MSNYTKITDFTAKDAAEAIIEGLDFDNEFSAIASMSTSKMDVTVPAAANSVGGLDATGKPYDTTVLVTELQAAVASTSIVGEIKLWTTDSVPSGWAFCDGTSYTTASQSDLFAVLAYDYGGSGANFNVPDLRGRVPLGQDDMGGTSANRITAAAADALAGAGGSETHTLSTSESPAHTHTGTTASDGTHSHNITMDNNGGNVAKVRAAASTSTSQSTSTDSAGAHTHTFTTASSGGGGSHNNVQPYLVLNYIIKT